MSSITEIQQAILSLPETDYLQLGHWFNELNWEKWDRQIEEDSDSGKLDFLIAKAREIGDEDFDSNRENKPRR